MQTIHLDVSTRRVPMAIYAKQGDVGRKFKVVITDNGNAFSIPAGALFSVWYSGTSGEGNYTAIGQNSAFLVSGNTVEVELITQMLGVKGGGVLCLVMNDETGKQIGFWNIPYVTEVVPGLESSEAIQNFTAFSETVMKLAALVKQATEAAETFQTDETLTKAGTAADAQAVGSALNEKAPAKSGIGRMIENTKYLSSANDPELVTGFYMCTVNTVGLPADWGGGPLFVMAVDSDRCMQMIFSNNLSQYCVRCYLDGVWNAWEYSDPSMVLGVEYRTTERYNGKPVYAKVVDCGALPNASNKDIVLTDGGIEEIVDCRTRMAVESGIREFDDLLRNSNAIDLYGYARPYINANKVLCLTIKTAKNLSAYTAACTVKYTKTSN